MGLEQLLVNSPPPDDGGSIASNRFDYQISWALRLLLETHQDGNDYCLILDYHDDVVLLDSAQTPEFASFYQVKTKDKGRWSVADLVRRPPGKAGPKDSKVGKLLRHLVAFGDAVAEVCIISNAHVSACAFGKSKKTDYDELTFSDLEEAEQQKIHKCRQAEHPSLCPDACRLFAYKRSDMTLAGHRTHCTGTVTDFLEAHTELTRIPAGPFTRTLRGQLARLQGQEATARTFQDLLRLKCITRQEFSSILQQASVEPQASDICEGASEQLRFESIGYALHASLQRELRRIAVATQDPHETIIRNDLAALRPVVAAAPTTGQQLFEDVEQLRTSKACVDTAVEARSGSLYAQAVLAYLIYEETILPRVDSQPEEEDS